MSISIETLAIAKNYAKELAKTSAADFRGSFTTKTSLLTAGWQSTDPSAEYYVDINDIAIVQADETHNNECWRYVFTTTGWVAQYQIDSGGGSISDMVIATFTTVSALDGTVFGTLSVSLTDTTTAFNNGKNIIIRCVGANSETKAYMVSRIDGSTIYLNCIFDEVIAYQSAVYPKQMRIGGAVLAHVSDNGFNCNFYNYVFDDSSKVFMLSVDNQNALTISHDNGDTFEAITASDYTAISTAGYYCQIILFGESTSFLLKSSTQNGVFESKEIVYGLDNKAVYRRIECSNNSLVYHKEEETLAAKLEANQGIANAGKFLSVGNDGMVVPVSVPAASGVNF